MSSSESAIDYAVWRDTTSGVQVRYALPAFHDIDFQVNEGYRRVPHGGIETGGILWGRTDHQSRTVTIEAFREIACQHASGPSFLLSPADLEALSANLRDKDGDIGLAGFEAVGWFIAHTRGSLTLTEREFDIFQTFFPGPNALTILVKPERFQPTRFGFLIRQDDGTVPRDAAGNAIILPLPGRASKSLERDGAERASIPAPKTPADSAAPPAPKRTGRIASLRLEDYPEPIPASDDLPPASPARPAPEPEAPSPSQPLPPPTPAPRPRPAEQVRSALPDARPPTIAYLPPPPSLWTRARLVTFFLLSALLGSAAGYVAYLQLPSPYIPLEAHRHDATLLVLWPASDTRYVERVTVRLNDGVPRLLTDEQRTSGILEVPAASRDLKIELIAEHWPRDSRGILRYLVSP